METRLENQLGEELHRELWLGTFHAICARILRREADHLPFKSNFVIMDSDDQETIVKRIIKELNMDDKLYSPASSTTSSPGQKTTCSCRRISPCAPYRDEIIERVYERYQQRLLENNAVDFDDLLLMAVQLLEENPDVRERYARRFEHVLVDEFQDTNLAQYDLLNQLSPATTITCSWWAMRTSPSTAGGERITAMCCASRGLSPRPEDPAGAELPLHPKRAGCRPRGDRPQYHRARPKALFTNAAAGQQIVLYEAVDDYAEAAYVVDTIQQQVSAGRPAAAILPSCTAPMPSPACWKKPSCAQHALPAGGRPALLRAARGEGPDRLPAPGAKPVG